ncbi:MAG: hypothetical protein IJ849_01975, partial [Selenomonadaceae bacterium]|nr:hypothetical protein [Selenomonadaceae bacterium]
VLQGLIWPFRQVYAVCGSYCHSFTPHCTEHLTYFPPFFCPISGVHYKEWFAKIDEELNELKEAIIRADDWTRLADEFNHHGADTVAIAEEAADVITVITSMLESMEIDEDMRQKAQKAVNAKNKERGRC